MPFKIVLSELPIVVIEALEFGIDIITTEDSGIKKLVQTNKAENVLFVDNFNSEAYDRTVNFINSKKNKITFSKILQYIESNNFKAISELEDICQK